jgi:hypothetical protein
MIRSQHRCEACGTAFWFVRTRVRATPWYVYLSLDSTRPGS